MNTCSNSPSKPLSQCATDRGFIIPDDDLAKMVNLGNRIQMISGCSEDHAQGVAIDYYFNFGLI